MDNTLLQLVSLIVDLTNKVNALQKENAALKADGERLTPRDTPTP